MCVCVWWLGHPSSQLVHRWQQLTSPDQCAHLLLASCSIEHWWSAAPASSAHARFPCHNHFSTKQLTTSRFTLSLCSFAATITTASTLFVCQSEVCSHCSAHSLLPVHLSFPFGICANLSALSSIIDGYFYPHAGQFITCHRPVIPSFTHSLTHFTILVGYYICHCVPQTVSSTAVAAGMSVGGLSVCVCVCLLLLGSHPENTFSSGEEKEESCQSDLSGAL